MFVTITMTMDADTWAEMVSNNTAVCSTTLICNLYILVDVVRCCYFI